MIIRNLDQIRKSDRNVRSNGWASARMLLKDGWPVLGIIDQAISGERWVGRIGQPTLFNGKPAQTKPLKELGDAVLAIGTAQEQAVAGDGLEHAAAGDADDVTADEAEIAGNGAANGTDPEDDKAHKNSPAGGPPGDQLRKSTRVSRNSGERREAV